MDIYLALVHHPVLNRQGDVVATAVTNLDIHDLARIARTYDCAAAFVVTPIHEQIELVRRIISHWNEGEGRTSNPDRHEAFTRVEVVASLDAVMASIAARHAGEKPERVPLVIGTTARKESAMAGYGEIRERLLREAGPALILFGTGWGLAPDAMERANVLLAPIEAAPARRGYNHLPVRAACAIILDRLLGDHPAMEPKRENP